MTDEGPAPDRTDFVRAVPDGDTHERDVCARCGFISYDNPKVVVGSVVRAGDKVLMCRRAIDPRKGFWTLPAGFLELNETPEEGARREALEEANARIEIESLLAIYTIPRISQVQLIYRAVLHGDVAPGPESLEVALFAWDGLPAAAEIAFPSVIWALDHEREIARGASGPFGNPRGALGDMVSD
ncbi:ADP-ribose pyrophosphatase YjhB (NUDIX family) [Rhodobium orientis]|uniref:NUDIX hydrolase n=1 Tax=Rhodobium orientis TaxID=34017 RepID=A0A327JM61_9HYPH|nr:NUDIX hydrolase [Rhodobium orientis]MBB4305180.1 ADP-ribose pyrophosphatase YjhB (NUDIX family) [Rhodobium orientis]MBK5949252.1 NUDIX hydrolase [Rhodobium orientis]RAI26666.1 NUDIX hydrolase [Rhodobium orientis]